MPKYFVCSIGEPGEGYDDENLCRCIKDKGYRLNLGCTQRGPIEDIQTGDILILKYKDELIGYGRVTDKVQKEQETPANQGWGFIVPVTLWITGSRVPKYGIQVAQLSGSPYDAVKEVQRSFALEKIEDIGFPF